jgi:hypothetical protein
VLRTSSQAVLEAGGAKLFPVIVICHGCNLERINPSISPNPRLI